MELKKDKDIKNWIVDFDHKDGRYGSLNCTTVITKSGAASYGNGLCGRIIFDGTVKDYDLRYCLKDDLHKAMLDEYFGKGLVCATEIKSENNKYYKENDGWFSYYVNKATGEKKFELEEGDELIDREVDDFER